jgi:hypothetical protein
MSDQVPVIPAGSPVHINLNSPAPAEPVQLREGKVSKREEALAEAKSQGANDVLKSLGIKKAERGRMIEAIRAGRMKLAEAKEEAAAAKQEVVAKTAEVDAFKPYKDQVEQLTGKLKEYADQEFGTLPEAFQKTLVDMKLDDPAARLDMIKVWKKNGVITAAQAQAATTAVTSEAAKPASAAGTKPSNTMAQTPADVKTIPGPAANHYEQWKQLTDSNQHFLAAQYFQAHQIKILEQLPKIKA